MINNIVIFGGTFNPVHNGHINMALETQSFLGGADKCKIVFMPNRSSVWKNIDISSKDKLNMINLAIEGYKNLVSDDFELNNPKDNYSYITIQHYLDLYEGTDTKLYFLIGSDQVELFHLWKNADLISKQVQFLYFARPNEIITNDNIRKFNILRVESRKMVDVSSSDVRDLKDLNVPDSVLNYIHEHNLYFLKRVATYIDEKRFLHSKSVGIWSKKVADSNHIKDSWRYYVAGLLHDIGKNVPLNVEKEIEEKYKEFLPIDKRLYHQFYGAMIAKSDFKINDEEILDAINYHATGKANMNQIGKVVYAVDKTDPLRGYDSSDMLNALLKNIDDGFIYVLRENKKHLISKGRDINNKLTLECFNCYLEKGE